MAMVLDNWSDAAGSTDTTVSMDDEQICRVEMNDNRFFLRLNALEQLGPLIEDYAAVIVAR